MGGPGDCRNSAGASREALIKIKGRLPRPAFSTTNGDWQAEDFIERAHRVAERLELGIAGQPSGAAAEGRAAAAAGRRCVSPAYDLERKA